MLTLRGDGLSASVLEPLADQARLGSRYCAGGYVWQVTDARHGAIFAGPAFPAAEPPPFDGQGCPEVFETALGQARAKLGDDVYVLGVGRVRRESSVRPFHVRDNPTVVERAAWDVAATASRALFRSRATFEDFAFELERTLTLDGRTLTSATVVRNTGALALPVRWFAHPFFPWAGERCCRLSLESALPAGAALDMDADGFLTRRPGVDWALGHYLLPRIPLGAELSVEQCHPQLGTLRAECRFPLGGLALWGNSHTFSFEPFFQTIVLSQAEASWAMAYTF